MSETERIKRGLSRSGRDAYNRILADGNDAFFMRGNSICSQSPDGKLVEIVRLPKTKVRVKSSVYNLRNRQGL